MADIKKVIKGLECITSSGNAGMRDDCARCIYPGGGDCLAPALTDSLALLKAQEPVEPKHENDRPISPMRCGNCEAYIVVGNGYKAKFCYECGRAVKWDE